MVTLTFASADAEIRNPMKILENEMWKFGRTLPLATFGSERYKKTAVKPSNRVKTRD